MKVKVIDINSHSELSQPYSVSDKTKEYIMAVDGSTTNTGVAIFEKTGKLVMLGAFAREPMRESPVRYKLILQSHLYDLLRNYRHITTVLYEEPCMDNISAIPNLYMLRPIIQEILITHEDELTGIKYMELANAKWKHTFLKEMKWGGSTERQKECIAARFAQEQPYLTGITQDEKDAYGMGKAYIETLDKSSLESKKGLRAFKYNTAFVGMQTGTPSPEWLYETAIENKVPKKVLDDIQLIQGNGSKNFERTILEGMGTHDRLLVLAYSSKKLGNLNLRFKLGELSQQFPYIAVLVWRTNRKKRVEYTI